MIPPRHLRLKKGPPATSRRFEVFILLSLWFTPQCSFVHSKARIWSNLQLLLFWLFLLVKCLDCSSTKTQRPVASLADTAKRINVKKSRNVDTGHIVIHF